MCGIAGLLGHFHFLEEKITKMTRSLSHRGPDAEGFYTDNPKGVALGHRRLSVLDLSEQANQPFHSKCGRYVMVYNGEVYNYKEIAKELNLTLTTHCDTEVLIEAFSMLGCEFVQKLNGMFAIAIWDEQDEKLYFFRDRLGIKPLYYYKSAGEFIFASELKALTTVLTKEELSVNQTAIADFLYLGYVPGNQVIFNKIHKFPAGHYGIYTNNNFQIIAYWEPKGQIKKEIISDEITAKKQLDYLLKEAVSSRILADVPLGVFLSGGIDSSTIAAIAQNCSPQPIKTFSIGFKDSKHDESEYARKVANHLKTEHYEFTLSKQDVLERFDKILEVYDEPFADSSSIPTLLVSEMTRKNVTVALSGDGGDELFLGYGTYQWAKRLNNPLVKVTRKTIHGLLQLSNNNRLKRGAMVFDYKNKSRLKSHIFSQEQYCFSETEIESLLLNNSKISIDENYEGLERTLGAMEEQAMFDINNYLKDDLLVKVDRASMHHSLEARVPFLDHRIVEFALNLDEKLKVKKGQTKYLLKQVLFDYVPKPIFDRPKWGFSIPLNVWLTQELKYLIDDYLNDELVESLRVVDVRMVQDLKTRFWAGENYLYNRIWLLILLHKWFKNYLM